MTGSDGRAAARNLDVDVSIVVVSYNCSHLLRDCLDSVPAGLGRLRGEVIVVDSASRDGSAELAARHAAATRVLRASRNLGFARGNNVGLASARGAFVLLLNPDTIVAPGALEQMHAFMNSRKTVGFCGPKLLNTDGSHQASARRFPTPFSTFLAMTGLDVRLTRGINVLDLHRLHGKDKPFRAAWLSGACLMMRRDCWQNVGPLDEGYFLYFEETDWCRRAQRKGWQGWYIPTATVIHLGGGTISHDDGAKAFSGDHPVHWVRSSRRYMRKHWGEWGAVVHELLQLVTFGLKWVRHYFGTGASSRIKAASAAKSVRYLLATR